MTVLTVCDGAGITGGTEKVAVASAIGMAQRGVASFFFAGEGELDPALQENGVVTYTMGLTDAYNTENKKELLKRFFWNKRAANDFARFLDDHQLKPENTVIHFHGFRRVLSASVVKVAKERGFKSVFTLHDFGIACPNTTFFIDGSREICIHKPLSVGCWTCQCTHSGWKMKAMQMGRGTVLAAKHVVDDFDHFIYVSDFSRKILEKFLPKTPSTTLYNPVTQGNLAPANPGDSDVFTYIGRLNPEKGTVVFAEAAAKAGVRARFVGKGIEEPKLREICPNAEFTGWVPPAEVDRLIRNSRAVVMPSVWYETAGLSVIESVARGVPVIVSDRCASVEYMTHARSGVIYPGNDPDALAKVLAEFSAQKAIEYGAAAYEDYWRDPLTSEKYLDGLHHVYLGLFK